eukprot:scaffold723_cov298-Alexandrium_tamarense.AAC.3
MSDALMDVARVLMLSESRSVFFVGALEGGGEKSGRLTRSMFNVEDFQDGGAIVGWGIIRGYLWPSSATPKGNESVFLIHDIALPDKI